MAPRYHIPQLPESGTLRLGPEESHHVRNVMRMSVGAAIVLFDGRGFEADGRIAASGRGSVEVEVLARRTAHRRTRHVEVAFSPPRGGRLEQLIEHGTELGIAAFRPLVAERTPPAARELGRRDRLEKVLRAAAGQSGAAHLPELAPPCPLAALCDEVIAPFAGERWLARATGERSKPVDVDRAPPAIVVVGPEGGFTEDELALLDSAGCRSLDLGPHTLRIETAVLAATTLLLLAPPAVP